MLSYIAAEQKIISHLVDGAAIDSGGLQSHCVEALDAFLAVTWPKNGLRFARPDNRQERVEMNGVSISMKPSLLVSDDQGNRGACKLFFNKPPSEDKPQLDETVARKMASLLYYYGHDYLHQADYKPTLCSVWCVRDGEIVQSTGRVSKLIADVNAACLEIKALWGAV